MTKANGLKDKRLIKGKQRKPAVPKDKFGKRILMDKYEYVNRETYIPNTRTFKTIQLDMTMWIKPQPGLTTNSIENSLYLIKKKIKEKIRNLKIPIFRQESIVEFRTGNSSHRVAEIGYLEVDIVFYVIPFTIYDKPIIKKFVEVFSAEVIDDYLLTSEEFQITRNLKIEGRTLNV